MEQPTPLNATDTICAISTPPGAGGIAVIRISGPEAVAKADSLWRGTALASAVSHTAHLGTIIDPVSADVLDQCVATVFRAPRSFTGDDVVEISVHGSTYIQHELLRLLIEAGCRMAEPGEFTRRAFASGRLDLAQAEAVADVIASTSRAAHRMAVSQMRGHFSQALTHLRQQLLELASLLELELDFSEEEVEFASRSRLRETAHTILDTVSRLADSFATGNAIRNGIPVAIVGRPNAGKSTLLNALLGDQRAIVSDIPGTTRDTVEDTATIGGTTFRFIDTAGIRHTTDTIERLGIDRAISQIKNATIVIWLADAAESDADRQAYYRDFIAPHINTDTTRLLRVTNKCDLSPATAPTDTINISALDGTGIDNLRQHLAQYAAQAADVNGTSVIVSNLRHYQQLTKARQSITDVIHGLDAGIPTDLVAQDVRHTIHHLGEITGHVTTADILQNIFSHFCIGK